MKTAPRGKAATAANPTKPQKTLLDFFQRQAQTSSPVEKVTCPGCNLQVPKSKINWHLDRDCKSKSRQKKVACKFKSLKNRKLLKAIKDSQLKTKKGAVLSDSEDEDISLVDVKENEKPDGSNLDSDSDGIYISSSMVETQIFETENDPESVPPSQMNTNAQSLSPYFSPGCKQMKSTPTKRHEKVIDFTLPKVAQNLAVLVSDWDSPQATPEKDPEDQRVNASKLLPSYSLAFTPQTKSGKEVKTMLEEDWDCNSPGKTPKKKETNNLLSPCSAQIYSENMGDFQKTPVMSKPKIFTPSTHFTSPVLAKQEKSNLSCKETEVLEDSGSDDFEKTTMVMRTPKKSPLKHSLKSVSPKSPKNSLKSVSPKSPKNSLKSESPKISSKSVSPKSTDQSKNFALSSNKELKTDLDDFETSTFAYRTPKKHSPSKERKFVSPRPVKSIKEVIEMKNESYPKTKSDEQESALSVLKSPEANGESDIDDDETGSLTLFSPIGSLECLDSTRLPSPLPSDEDTGESHNHVRQLFTPSPSKSDKVSLVSTEPKVKVNVTSEVRINVKKFAKVPKPSGTEGDIFDSLLLSSSQESKNYKRSPWKVKQGLRKTGLLQNSSQDLSASMIVRKKQSISPSDSASNSPVKFGAGEPSPFSNIGEGGLQRIDRAAFRQSKGYYLENFLGILDTVLSQPQDVRLLNNDDLEIIKTFQSLSLSAQKLYVRLFQRKIKWNRLSKIEYRDICDQEDMELYVNELGYADFLLQEYTSTESEMDNLEEVLHLLSCGELQGFCKQMKISSTGKKGDLVAALLKFSKEQTTITSAFSKGSSSKSVFLKRAKVLLGRSCIVNKEVRRVFMRVFMLYGLPRYDDDEEGGQQSHLTTLLMVNMGKMKFPQLDIIRNHAIFRSRDDLIRFETCSQILSEVQECMEGKKWNVALQHCELGKTIYQDLLKDKDLMDHDSSLPRFLRRFTSVSLLKYILTCSVECYQRIKSYQKAVDQLQELLDQDTHLQDYRGRWYDRLALNLEMHLRKPSLAVEAISKALNDPEVRKGHRLSLSMRAERMAASARYKNYAPIITEMPLMNPREAPKVIIEGRTIHSDIPGFKRLFIRQDSDRHAGEGEVTVCSVEELVLKHYKEQGYSEGLHREGYTVNTLFAIYFWDTLYAPVSDVFRSPHQAAPLDLDDANFYMARKEQIDNRLAELYDWSEEEAGAELERVWNDHSGEMSLVSWELFRSLHHAKGLVISMGLPLLSAICERLAKDHRFTRSGFPDLVVWNPNTKRCRIVEVKGPNDRLSTKQILWLDYLLNNGASAEVCHVEAIGAKKMKRATPRKISPKKGSAEKTTPKKSNNSSASDSDWMPEKIKREQKKKKIIPENDESTTKKITNGDDFKEKNTTDSDSSSGKRITRSKVNKKCEEVRKEITKSDTSERKNTDDKGIRKEGRKSSSVADNKSRRKKGDDENDFEKQTRKKRKVAK